MTYLAKVRKCDLSKLAYELGEVVPPESRIVDLKRLILNSQSYEEEFAKQLLETLIEEREQTERAERERMEQTAQTEQAERIERERIEDRKRIEDRERIERKEQMVMEFELEKLRIQTTRGNNDTSRSTSNDAHYEIRKLMPKYESKDNDLSFYLILFERQAKRLGLDEDQWAFSLLGLLPYEMTQLIARETEEQSGDYRFVKRLLLKRYKLSPEQFRQKFEKHERSQKGSWRDFAFELRGYFNEWIEGMNVENFDALKDLSVTNQLKKKVPNVLRNHLIDDWTKLNNPDELADKLDEYENVRTEMGPPHWNAKHLIPPSFQQKSARFPNQSEVKETKQGTNVSGQDAARNEISETYPNTLRRMVNRAIRNDKGEPKCFNCNQFGHIARDCPAPRTTLTCRGCGQTGHKERNCTRPKEGLKVANLEVEGLETVPPDVYLKDVKIDNKETVKAMIDTGSSSCLMRESVARRISVDIEPDSTSLYGIGNQTAPAARTVGKTTVDLEIDGIVGREITVFIVNDDAQPYDLLIGRTWTDLPYVSFARIGKNLHIGYSSEFPFANLQEEIKSRRIELRATETVQLESDSINFTSAITDEVKDGYVLFTGVDDACVDSLLEVVDGKTTVPIISAGKGKLRVRKNQCVGRVELLNLDDIVVNLDVAEDSFQTKNEEKREGQDQMKRKRPILPEDINVNHSLTSKERQEILDVVNEYRDCFALGMEELGCTDVTKMDIKEVDGSKPVCLRPYKTTASEREAIREIVREWKDNGIVTETRSPYASPVLLVRKKTGDHRLVVDYRRLNIQTVKDKFPLPRIDDLLEGLRNAKFFTTLDLAHGYLQIPLTDKAKLKTAFITPDDTDLSKGPAQIVVLAAQISWSEEVESALQTMASKGSSEDYGPLESVLGNVEQTLNVLADSVLHEQPPLRRKKLEHLITEFVHKRDTTRELIRNQVNSPRSFEWLRRMRFSLDTRQGDVLQQLTIHMANARFNYGFEYLGVQDKLVQTPLTDRCYLTMTQALESRLGGSPFGPAGTGKTESVKALGHQLGRFVLVFNCDETFDFQAMGRIFVGLCQVGAWGCFDEFNRLEERMLSAVSQQIQTIQETLKNAQQAVPGSGPPTSLTVELIGKQVRVSPDMAIFITMNPGYAGRSNLPDNLKKLFRSLAMTKPDRQLIAQVMLFSQGFRNAEKLASKIVPFFKLCGEQLSNQSHYDFGLRALKSVLVSAGNIKRDRIQHIKSATQESVNEEAIAQQLPEQEILIQSVCETLVPKLVAEDIPLLFSLLTDVFPGVGYNSAEMAGLRDAVKTVCAEMFLVAGEQWVQKVLQLYQISQLNHGLMMVGPSGAGKTTAWRVLLRALERYEGDREMVFLNPPQFHAKKAISKEALYGTLDPNTREWTDGLFTHVLRKIIDNVRGEINKRQWIIFDGDVDPEWVENLNSVLDDNKLLTLPNGERLSLPPNVRIMFEVQDLRYATLATVTSCSDSAALPLEDSDEDEHSYKKKIMGSDSSKDDHLSPTLQLQRDVAAILSPYFSTDGLVVRALEFAAKQEHVMDFTRLRALGSLFSMLNQAVRNLLSYNHSHPDFPLQQDQLDRFVPRALVYSLLWSFAGDGRLKTRSDLGDFLRGITTIPLPPSNVAIIDYE
ncbi:DYNC1H1, partial [Cordylochernes scorpioides]